MSHWLPVSIRTIFFSLFGFFLTWFAFLGGFVSNIRSGLRAQKEEIQKANIEIKIEVEERKHAQAEKERMIIELQDALSKEINKEDFYLICLHCKKIRDDNGYWNQIEWTCD